MIDLAIKVHTLCLQLASVNATSKVLGGNTDKPNDHSNDTPGLDHTYGPPGHRDRKMAHRSTRRRDHFHHL